MLSAQDAEQEDSGGSDLISLADVPDVVKKPYTGRWEQTWNAEWIL